MLKYVSKKRHHADSRICIWLQNHFITYSTQCVCKIDINPTTFMSNKTLWHYSLMRKFEYILISNHLIWGFRKENRKKNTTQSITAWMCLKSNSEHAQCVDKKDAYLKQGQTKPRNLFQMSDHSNGKNQGVLAISQKKYPFFWLGGS